MKFNIQGSRLVDLSHPLSHEMPTPDGFAPPRMEFIQTVEGGGLFNLEKLDLLAHTGTHMDAPSHFFADRDPIDALPLDAFVGPAVVVDLRRLVGSVPIEEEHLREWERETGETIAPGDAALLMTGYSKRWALGEKGRPFTLPEWPYMTKGAAEYLVGKKVRLVGVESMDIDLVRPGENPPSAFTGHRILLPNDIYIIESLANLDRIGSNRCQLIAVPLKIAGGTGSPVRAIAVV